MKRFAVALFVMGGLLAGSAAAFFFGIGYYLSPQDSLTKADAIVAISGGDTDARTAEAVRLYQNGWASHLIFSGAALDPNSPSNASAMARAAEKAGVPATAIILDEAAANTRQNATGVGTIVNRNGYQSLILVTSPYHQRRASLLFHRAVGRDVQINNHSSYDQEWRRSHWWATPTSRALTFAELQKVAYELLTGQST
jgi:uncharacterized SAM-binding protein YcdF (DUF218 family)